MAGGMEVSPSEYEDALVGRKVVAVRESCDGALLHLGLDDGREVTFSACISGWADGDLYIGVEDTSRRHTVREG